MVNNPSVLWLKYTKTLVFKVVNNKCIKMHKNSSKTVKNEFECQKNAKNPAFELENEGKYIRNVKKIKKYSKRVLTNEKWCSIISTSISFFFDR